MCAISFLQLEKCEKLANFELIDELNGLVGDTKWSEVKNRSLSEKLDFWNAKYATFSCEHAKMKIMVWNQTHYVCVFF